MGITHRSMHRKLPRAITFDPTIGFSRSIPFQKQEVKIFSGVSGSTLFLAFQGRRLKTHFRAINSPRHPTDQEDHIFFWILPSAQLLYTFLSFKHQKHTSKLPNSSLLTKNRRYCPYTQSSFPWFYTLVLGFRGLDVAFLAIIHTPNLLNLFLAFILLFFLE